tara:strand:+ start:204 stop:461 length:258 start_codon:yes stop_codon:yes gene_type:complete
MKITKQQLKQIIKEELEYVMDEALPMDPVPDKHEKSTEEKIGDAATQIISVTKTSGDLETIERLAMEIMDLLAPDFGPWDPERGG